MDFEAKKKEYQGLLVEEYRMLHKEETDGLTDEEVALMNPLSDADITAEVFLTSLLPLMN